MGCAAIESSARPRHAELALGIRQDRGCTVQEHGPGGLGIRATNPGVGNRYAGRVDEPPTNSGQARQRQGDVGDLTVALELYRCSECARTFGCPQLDAVRAERKAL